MHRLCVALFIVLLFPVMFGSPVSAQEFDAAKSDVDERLRMALKELSDTRARIAEQKVPLSRTVLRLEDDVISLRRRRGELIKIKDSRTIDLSSLRAQVKSLRDQEEFVDNRLGEFVREFEARLDISELGRYEDLTAAARLSGRNVNLDEAQKRDTQLAVVEAALERIQGQLGGEVFAGEALSPKGVLTAGRFIALGPTVFYASDDGQVTGLVENQLNAADPVVVALPSGFEEGIRRLAAGAKGALAFDATLGKALKKEKASKSLFEYVEDGGAVGYVIIALGTAALLLTLFKAFEITGFSSASLSEVDSIVDELARGNEAAAAQRAEQIEGVAGEILTTGVEHADEKRGVIEELLFEKILRARPSLERFLPFLAITAAASPLLGLLGTVIGMIKTFQLITIFGTGDAKSLSSGISEALVTTALGLIVAIPVLIVHGALNRMAKHKLGLLEQLSVSFVNGVAALRPTGER